MKAYSKTENRNSDLVYQPKNSRHYEVNWGVFASGLIEVNQWGNFVNPRKLEIVVHDTSGLGVVPGLIADNSIKKGFLSRDTANSINDIYDRVRNGAHGVQQDIPEHLPDEILFDLMVGVMNEFKQEIARLNAFLDSIFESERTDHGGWLYFWAAVAATAACAQACSSCSKSCKKNKEEKDSSSSTTKKKCFPSIPPPMEYYDNLLKLGLVPIKEIEALDLMTTIELFVSNSDLDFIGLSFNGQRALLLRNGLV